MRLGALTLVSALFTVGQVTTESQNVAIVRGWADRLGEDLWRLTSRLTRLDEIKRRYNELHIKVKRKNEASILNSAVESVGRMLQSKIDAVKCIHHTAQKLASEFKMSTEYTMDNATFEYCSSKYSGFTIDQDNSTQIEEDDRPECAIQNAHHYSNITLNEDSHFYNIPVNTERSCVQVPTNIYDREYDALEAILWSEDLDKVFRQNYESDPSLAWQYFGSSTGILRLFPGMPWNKRETDVFDCRVRSWYIEAATCSKDVIILFDVSGSMTGFRNYVARATLKTLLETLSNNDYINVYTFKNETKEAVACFTDLVQATPENLKTITDALEPTDGGKKHKVPLEGYANLTTAYITAFEKLKVRRQTCSTREENLGCNQLVMLITDYVPGNLTEVFESYNRERAGNETKIPVRVFTYLIGKEVTNVREIQWMACLNRGYYVHIHSIEEVQQQVLKYINVIARPMILVGDEPPPTWTHAYIDDTRTKKWGVSNQTLPDADKLVTSVAIPAFMSNEGNDQVTRAELLGVAGTDVPIDSIAKLAQPHQLGVNGYSFIVSNNGYLLLHPSLVTFINGELQINLNSVDLVEVEQVDDGQLDRQLGDEIRRLRMAMVNSENGNLTGIPVLFHYDGMRRIALVKQNYFYNKLEGTPFCLGISLPEGYGNTFLDVGDIWEVDFGSYSGIQITQYFNSSYRVHPDWVYCKYHYQEGHEMETPEKEVWHFLRKMSQPGWKWSEQYANDSAAAAPSSEQSFCYKRAKLDKNDYYCNKDLVQMLVFDAKLTDPFFKKWVGTEQELRLAREYGASVRFISTSSGLTRWHYLQEDGRNEVVGEHGDRTVKEAKYQDEPPAFGDVYPRAIEETWYMSAVLQHVIRDETLVVAVNFTAGQEDHSANITVTASYAIFAREFEEESPASVVGIQFQYSSWRDKFERLTDRSHVNCDRCIPRCDGDSGVRCYLVDSSGYILMSEAPADVGKFFGERQPRVMLHLTDEEVFREKIVYDYQAVCGIEDLRTNCTAAGWRMPTPFSLAGSVVRWILVQLAGLLNEVVLAVTKDGFLVDYDDLAFEQAAPATTPPPPPPADAPADQERGEYFACDKQVQLYILQTERLKDGAFQNTLDRCTPPYTAVAVRHTNLLLVAVDARGWAPLPECAPPRRVTTEPQPTFNSTQSTIPCHKLALAKLDRRRLEGCYTYHKKEAEINDCGTGSLARCDVTLLSLALIVSLAPLLAPPPHLPLTRHTCI